ncbi:MAG: glycosyltransferase family 25 protein [Alphaproteobacteria bacterium]|nr:glycosyltransferase family 25 protein [Alphaproteobacteria bacterium]
MNRALGIPPIFIINLPRDAERRETMRARAAGAALEVEFIEAVDGRALTLEQQAMYDRKKRLRYFGRDLMPGEIGCLLSHYKIFKKMDAENIPHAVILEDDVIFEPEIKEVLQALLQSKTRWDVIRFLGSEKIYKRGCRRIVPLTGKYWLARLPTAPGGAHGYLLSLGAARVMIKHMRTNWLPIDTLQGRMWETGLETLVVHPAPLHIDLKVESTIGEKRMDKTIRLEGLDKIFFPFFRLSYRLGDTLGKRFIYWSSFFRDMRQKA